MYIDVHCHFEMLPDPAKRIAAAQKANVTTIVAAGTTPKTNRKLLELATEFPAIKPALGVYPIDALKLTDTEFAQELTFIEEHKDSIVAIGEVGMDFKEDDADHARQTEHFTACIKLAKKLDKPLVVHSRKAEKECIDMLEELGAKKVVMHCFSGNFKLVKRIVENGWTCSIPTCVTHAEHFQKMIREIPIEQLLCETDAPYMHPEKEFPNEPANVVASYTKIAALKQVPINQVAKQLTTNYTALFG